MSGIFGFSTKYSDADKKYLHALNVFNRCYGQDGFDTYLSDQIGMGCCQEHFSDTFPASPPVIKQDNRIAVIDAVLYNRDELIPQLTLSSAVSDEELLLQWIREKGYPSLAQVNGDFAGAIYDVENDTWTLFRDHSGVRPLFYYLDADTFAFSTDMRGLTALPNADMSVNEEKLYARMAGYNDLTLCETEYKNIHCIRPASWTVIRKKNDGFIGDEHIYWKWRQKKIRMKSDEEYQAELRRLITDAVKRRLDAVPGIIGCELSGGLDSSVIAILISNLGREGRFFSWSSSPDEIPLMDGRDERKIIFDICAQENINCHFSVKDESRTIDDVMSEISVPYMNTYALSKGSAYVKSEGARVMFTGHGGDEGVSHRCNFYELWIHHEYTAFFRNIYRTTHGKNLRLLRTAKRAMKQWFIEQPHFRKPFHKEYSNSARFLNPQFIERMSKDFKPQKHYFAYQPYKYILQGGHRVRLDNIAVQGAENGVRYMVPFIDYRVLDFALSIPRAQFHNGYTNRYIYRAAFDDIIPQSLRDMHYKDTPSMDGHTPDIDLRAHFLDTKKRLLKYIDREYWSEYLDIDTIEKTELSENYTRMEYINASSMLEDILFCCLTQQLPIKTARWCDEHE